MQMAVQVLYFEQIRLRNAMNGSHNQFFLGQPMVANFLYDQAVAPEVEPSPHGTIMHQLEERTVS